MYGDFGGGRRGPPGRDIAPVSVGEELDVMIEAVGEKGDGVAKVKGFVLFIPNVKEGQNVKVRVSKVLRKVGFADVIGEGSATPAAAASGAQEMAPPEPEPSPEDSEDFGEEPAEEVPEKEPEEKKEEPATEEEDDEVPAPPEEDLDELPSPEEEVPEEKKEE